MECMNYGMRRPLTSYNKSYTNKKYSQDTRNEILSESEIQLPRLGTHETCENRNDVDHSLPAYSEIYSSTERSLPVTFSQTSLPSYESVINGSRPVADTSVPSTASLDEILPNESQNQNNCCLNYIQTRKTKCIIAAVFPITFLIFFSIILLLTI